MAISKKKRVRRRDTPPAPPPSMASSYLLEKEELIKKYAALISGKETLHPPVLAWFESEFKDVIPSAHRLILFDVLSTFENVSSTNSNTFDVHSKDFGVRINYTTLSIALNSRFCEEKDFTNAVISEVDREWLAFHSMSTTNLSLWIEAKRNLLMSLVKSVTTQLSLVQEKYDAEQPEQSDD